jgi:hypothetical protein
VFLPSSRCKCTRGLKYGWVTPTFGAVCPPAATTSKKTKEKAPTKKRPAVFIATSWANANKRVDSTGKDESGQKNGSFGDYSFLTGGTVGAV